MTARTRAAFTGLLILLISTPGCALLRKFTRPPKVTMERVRITKVTFDSVDLAAELKIRNRYPVQVPVPKIGYGLDVDGKELLSGALEKAFTLPSGNSSNPSKKVVVPVRMNFNKLYSLSQAYRNRDNAIYKLKGDVNIDTPIGPVAVPFEHKGTFPILKPPQIDMPEVTVRALNFQGADLRLKFRMRNPNNVNFNIKNFKYGLDIANMRVVDGTLPQGIELSAHGDATTNMDVHIGLQQVAGALQSVLQQNTLNYKLDGSFQVGTPWGPVNAPLKASGTANIRR